MIKNISNLGDAAFYCDFGNEIQEQNIKGITNLAPSYNKLIISFDLDLINFSDLKKEITKIKVLKNSESLIKSVKIPICCEDEFALDMERLKKKLNLSKNEILNNYLNKEYFCYMTGFVAGMPFLGDIDKKLHLNRLETPRVKVPKGSVGITEQFCNIYTFESPGGWNIIGRTPLKIFDKQNQFKPTLVNPGDDVEFYEVDLKEYNNLNE